MDLLCSKTTNIHVAINLLPNPVDNSKELYKINNLLLVQSFYDLTLNKLQHKRFKLCLVQKNVLYNILKVLRNPVGRKYNNFYF